MRFQSSNTKGFVCTQRDFSLAVRKVLFAHRDQEHSGISGHVPTSGRSLHLWDYLGMPRWIIHFKSYHRKFKQKTVSVSLADFLLIDRYCGRVVIKTLLYLHLATLLSVTHAPQTCLGCTLGHFPTSPFPACVSQWFSVRVTVPFLARGPTLFAIPEYPVPESDAENC